MQCLGGRKLQLQLWRLPGPSLPGEKNSLHESHYILLPSVWRGTDNRAKGKEPENRKRVKLFQDRTAIMYLLNNCIMDFHEGYIAAAFENISINTVMCAHLQEWPNYHTSF
jgi:hypothetical protein